jgi:uncharacterized membrane protein
MQLLLASLSLAPALAVAAPQAVFMPLPDPPGTPQSSQARGVNTDGSVVVGHARHPGLHQDALVWSAGGAVLALPDLHGGSPFAGAADVSADGSVVVGFALNPAGIREATHWTLGAMAFQALGQLAGGDQSEASGVSADGSVVGGLGSASGGLSFEGFHWTAATGMIGLGDLPGGGFESWVLDVSADGNYLVGSSATALGLEAFRWSSGSGMVRLDSGPQSLSSAHATSADGSTVVGYVFPPTSSCIEAARWTPAGGWIGLGTMPGSCESLALDVSADGSVIVGQTYNAIPATTSRAFLWTSSLGLVRLDDHLVQSGATGLSGWTLERALAISADGNAIVGSGRNPAGRTQAWLAFLTPPTFSIHESYCGPAVPNSSGQPGMAGAAGSRFVIDDAVELTITQIPASSFGYFLASQTEGSSSPPGTQGILCLAGNIGRLNQTGLVVQWPSAQVPLSLGAIPGLPPAAVQPGETWRFQCWYRDANPGPTSNFSDAIRIPFY